MHSKDVLNPVGTDVQTDPQHHHLAVFCPTRTHHKFIKQQLKPEIEDDFHIKTVPPENTRCTYLSDIRLYRPAVHMSTELLEESHRPLTRCAKNT